jgi:sulfite exporter TauE/SafE
VDAPLALVGQLLAIGIPWTLAHCPGMCGPIVIGLRLGARGVAAPTAARALADLAAYQLGRAAPYAVAGAVVGSGGSLVSGWRWGSAALTGLAALVLIAVAATRLPAIARRLPAAGLSPRIVAGVRGLAAMRARRPLLGAWAIGTLLSALPCGIALWALALAAASGSAAWGAGLMLGLIAINSAPLAAAALAPVVGARLGWRAPRWLVPTCLAVSATAMIVMAVAQLRAVDACPFCQAHRG